MNSTWSVIETESSTIETINATTTPVQTITSSITSSITTPITIDTPTIDATTTSVPIYRLPKGESLTEGAIAMIVIFSTIGGIGLLLILIILCKKRVI